MFWLIVNISFGQSKNYNDTIVNNLNNKIELLNKEVTEIKKWQTNQQELTNLTNEKIKDNLSYLDRISSTTTTAISIYAIILAILNIFLFIWIFIVQRNLRIETKELNKDTKKSNKEFDEKLNKKSEELNRKTEELYKQMLSSKYGLHDKKLLNEIINEDGNQEFENLNSYHSKIIHAQKELDDNDIRAAINHFNILLEESKKHNERDYIFNRIGIAYTKIGSSEKALEYFQKAFNETEINKKKYILNLLEQYIILGHNKEANDLIETCEKIGIDTDSLPVFYTLKFVFYVKSNDETKLRLLKKQQKKINWNQNSKWEFNGFKECFKEEYANDFSEIFRFSNILQIK